MEKHAPSELVARVLGSGLVRAGETVAVAVSGGSDSVCLLHLYAQNREALGIRLFAVHVNHGLRPEAGREEAFVRETCQSLGVPLTVRRADVTALCRERRVSVEEGARILRYRIFEDCFSELPCDAIAIAHNRGDDAETVLFHLIRGCGARGARGLLPVVASRIPGKRYIRPLLPFFRDEIADYLAASGLGYVEDPSNEDPGYARNRLRLESLPSLERTHAGASENLAAFGARMTALTAYLREQAKAFVLGHATISTQTPEVLLSEAMALSLEAQDGISDLSAVHLDAVASLKTAKNGARVNLPGGLVAERQYDRIAFFRREAEPYSYAFGIGTFDAGEFVVEVSDRPQRGGRILAADRAAIPPGAVIRSPRPGDRFSKFGGGTKKLCDLFTDWKVPRAARRGIPLIADGSRVLCVLTKDISADLACREGSRIVYFCTRKKEEV